MRSKNISSIKGFAVLLMIVANSWSYIFIGSECPFVFRMILSSVAPIFVFYSGYSVFLSIQNGKTKMQINTRAFQIILIAALLDSFVWGIIPFFSFDVLYIIGFSMIFLNLLRNNKNDGIIFGLALICFFINYFFSHIYSFNIEDVNFVGPYDKFNIYLVLRHFFIDGWFPAFPWLGVAIFGYLVAKFKNRMISYKHVALIISIACLASYIILSFSTNLFSQPFRAGYVELFYPFDYKFFLYFLFLIGLLFWIENSIDFSVFSKIGEVTLTLYIYHVVFIQFLIEKIVNQHIKLEPTFRLLLLFLFIFSIYILANLIYLFKNKVGNKNRLISFFIGL